MFEFAQWQTPACPLSQESLRVPWNGDVIALTPIPLCIALVTSTDSLNLAFIDPKNTSSLSLCCLEYFKVSPAFKLRGPKFWVGPPFSFSQSSSSSFSQEKTAMYDYTCKLSDFRSQNFGVDTYHEKALFKW